MKIMVGVNTLNVVDQLAYSNHCQFWYRLGKKHPEIEFILNNPRRMAIDFMRNMTAKIAVENNCDYLLFIDDDVLVPPDTLDKLLQADADIAAGWTIIRGHPFDNMFFKFTDDTKLVLDKYNSDLKIDANGLIECDAVGFSCCLIKCSVLKSMKPPYFVTGPYNTEDIYFCLKAKELNPDIKIVVHSQIETAHILGSEIIAPYNREAYKKYYAEAYPEYIKSPEQNKQQKLEFEESNIQYEEVLNKAVGFE